MSDTTDLTEGMARFAEERGLQAVADEGDNTIIFRRPGFEGIQSLETFDDRIGAWIKAARSETNLSQEEFGQFLGLTKIAYGRYERSKARLTLGRYIVICEILGLNPINGLYMVAPHLFGSSPDVAGRRRDVMLKIAQMPDDMLEVLHSMLTNIEKMKATTK